MTTTCRRLSAPFLALAAAALPFAAAAANAQQPSRTVESVVPRTAIASAAAKIDALVDRGLQRAGQQALPLVDDATFLRRAYLSIVGRIPTRKETEAFLADASPEKRPALIDALLDSPGRTSHFANSWFDLLRVKSRIRQTSGEPFAHWVREAIRTDLPYDRFVRELLTAEGPAHARGAGATGYLLRDANMPHDAMANTLRLFLGTRLECAQCHDHPSDVWKQKDFYAMAAFFGGLRYRPDAAQQLAGLRQAAQNAELDERTKQAARQLLQRMGTGIAGGGTGVERLPPDYKYDDAKPRSPVYADTLFGDDVKLERPKPQQPARPARGGQQRPRDRAGARDPEIGSRAAMAEWLTSPDTPRFLLVITNRMWARAFGRGLIDPVDDVRKDTVPIDAELQKLLEKTLVDLDFDLRQFERVLAHTKLFQRAAPANDPPEGTAWRFAGPLLRRMTAEQLWDSLLTLVFDDVDQRLRETSARAEEVYARYDEVAGKTPEQLLAMLQEPRFAEPGRFAQQQRERQRAMTDEQQKQARPLLQQLAQARRKGDQQAVAELTAKLKELGVPLPGERAARGREGDLLRASDLQQPAPPGHLLQQFGQSDRETMDAANTAANVPQALTLLNGFLDQRVLSGASALKRDLDAATGPERKVQVAFLTTLNRQPTDAELAEWVSAWKTEGPDALKDLVWVLCNGNEFRFVR